MIPQTAPMWLPFFFFPIRMPRKVTAAISGFGTDFAPFIHCGIDNFGNLAKANENKVTRGLIGGIANGQSPVSAPGRVQK